MKVNHRTILAIIVENDTFNMKSEQKQNKIFSQINVWVVTGARSNIDQISTFDFKKLLWAKFDNLV